MIIAAVRTMLTETRNEIPRRFQSRSGTQHDEGHHSRAERLQVCSPSHTHLRSLNADTPQAIDRLCPLTSLRLPSRSHAAVGQAFPATISSQFHIKHRVLSRWAQKKKDITFQMDITIQTDEFRKRRARGRSSLCLRQLRLNFPSQVLFLYAENAMKTLYCTAIGREACTSLPQTDPS
jgi:hypothetical protein